MTAAVKENGVSIALLVALCAVAPGAAQQEATPGQQPPAFRSGTQVVEVDARVFDKDGQFITNLTREDFEIKEDGVAQPIVTLTLVAGAPPAPSAPSAPAPLAPPAPSAPSAPSSVWLFVFDTTHLSAGGLHNTQKAVAEFLRTKFREGDVGGVVFEGKMANNRLTSNREELVKAVEDMKLPSDARSYQQFMRREWPRIEDEFEAWLIAQQNDAEALRKAVIRACSDDPSRCSPVPPDPEVRDKAKQVLTSAQTATDLSLRVIEALSNGLARMPGPKTVVFVSEGFLTLDGMTTLQHATGMANRAGAHFYTIDARGLNKGSSASSIIDEPAAFDSAGPSNHFDLQEDGTNALAVDTGGMAIRNENNFGRALDVVQRDAGTYYVLGYTPANQSFDGKFRRIDVSVKRPGLKVRARRGYLALTPARLLKPTPITTPSSSVSREPPATPPGSEAREPARSATPADAPTGSAESVPAPPSAPAAPAARALVAAIESHKLVQELQSAQRLSPTTASDLAGRGWAAYQKGDLEHAAVYLAEASKSPDAHPWVRYALGLAHLALAHYPEAVASWEQVRRDVPEFEPVYFNLADGYMLQKDNDTALKVLRSAQERWPKDAEVWNATGVLEIRRGAIDAAIRSFTRATTVDPTDSLGFFNLAKAYQMRASQSQRFDSTRQKWVGGESDTRRATENYTKYVQMGGPFVQQAKEALQVLAWKS
jgi:VWFA-related protein